MASPLYSGQFLRRACAGLALLAGAFIFARAAETPKTTGGVAGALAPATAFKKGEQLSYTLFWGPIEVGHADWQTWIVQNKQGEDELHSIIFLRTNQSLDEQYRVRAFTRTWAPMALDRSLQYNTEQQERDRLRDIGLLFDTAHKVVRERPFDPVLQVGKPATTPPMAAKITKTPADPAKSASAKTEPAPAPALTNANAVSWPMPGPTFDPLAALLSYRFLPFQVGLVQKLAVCDGRSVSEVTVRVLRKEKVTTPTGTVTAWVVQPDSPGGGLFLRSSSKPLTLWIDEVSHRPVRFTGQVGTGSFTADLTAIAPYSPTEKEKSDLPVAAK